MPKAVLKWLVTLSVGCSLFGCSDAAFEWVDEVAGRRADLSTGERRTRAALIRDTARRDGVFNGVLLAGIAEHEGAGMAHCWSEATWACQGPSSPDCNDGPILAGAGDGPCSSQQGGLGMFQFDGGTYAQTLAREGDRILRLEGSVEAAIDFVIDNVIIPSQFIANINTRTQALAWFEEVRIDGVHFDAWVDSLLFYYNGCRSGSPTCMSRRQAYADAARRLYTEFGEDFWYGAPAELGASFVEQSFPLATGVLELHAGEIVAAHLDMLNTGRVTWQPNETLLVVTEPRGVPSVLTAPDWISATEVATVQGAVAPDQVGRFAFSLRAPAQVGEYSQFFGLEQDQVRFSDPDQGGPPDDQLQVRVRVVAADIDAGTALDAGNDAGTLTDGGFTPFPDAGHQGDAGLPSGNADCAIRPRVPKPPASGWFFALLLGVATFRQTRRWRPRR